ncbi:MAG: hypothetical protein ACRDS9_27700 [Pseudonocardiaceae bacterium]
MQIVNGHAGTVTRVLGLSLFRRGTLECVEVDEADRTHPVHPAGVPLENRLLDPARRIRPQTSVGSVFPVVAKRRTQVVEGLGHAEQRQPFWWFG